MLIKSILFHYQVYWSNIVLLPKKIVQKIDSICRDFLWSGRNKSKKMPLVAWESVCLPRSEGGLGVLQIAAWNKAALGKLLWKIVADWDCLWVRWVKAVYLKGKTIWCTKAKDSHPWYWKKILNLRELFREHLKCQLGDGRQFSLFYDNDWLQIGTIQDISGNTAAQIWGMELKVRDCWNDGWNIPSSFSRRFPTLQMPYVICN